MINLRTAPYGILLLRITIGALFILHLYLKFAILGVDKWWTGLEQAGYPGWVLTYTISGEFVGAVLITLGVYTRWACLYALPLMIGATQFVATRKGFYYAGGGFELPLVWSLLLIAQSLLGDGAYALRPGELFAKRDGRQQIA
jgi:putative oxidoreductase